ncbi:MAG: electron transport complex subunit RsxA [Erysipelotrichaceae bacterium]|nr:electron transport complex subunit RsxA [Erysipelotrichaceae bacterium]
MAIVSYAIVNNVVLSRFYGICSFIGVGNKVKSSLCMGAAVSFVIILAAAICWPLYNFILVPAGAPFLDTIAAILVIACLVMIVGIVMKKFLPALYTSLGIYLPLITTNCAVLGVVSENIASKLDFGMAMANAIGTSAGFTLVIFLYACIRVRLEASSTPKAFKGIPIALVVASIMAMAFLGLAGIGA